MPICTQPTCCLPDAQLNWHAAWLMCRAVQPRGGAARPSGSTASDFLKSKMGGMKPGFLDQQGKNSAAGSRAGARKPSPSRPSQPYSGVGAGMREEVHTRPPPQRQPAPAPSHSSPQEQYYNAQRAYEEYVERQRRAAEEESEAGQSPQQPQREGKKRAKAPAPSVEAFKTADDTDLQDIKEMQRREEE